MADTGWVFPGTADSLANKFAFTFNDVVNVKADDGLHTYAIGAKVGNDPPVDVPGAGVELRTRNYGFSIPESATITGIEAQIEGYTDSNVVGELAYLGNPAYIGTYKDNEWTDMPIDGPDGDWGVHTYGSSADLWGATLTPAIVNGTDFGWIWMIYDDVAPLQAGADYMKLKIHYEIPTAIVIVIGA